MNKAQLLQRVKKYVKETMQGEVTGHDWFHVERVHKTALLIARQEKSVDAFVVELAALLHDIGDYKVNTSEFLEEELLAETMRKLGIPEEVATEVTAIILNMSYSKNVGERKKLTLEGKIVQDADRLEALGAIGIARAFAYGGKKQREMYNPSIKPQKFTSTDAYRSGNQTTINHFYEKLFLLKKQLNTKAAKKIATKREKFMKDFLKEFYAEWAGKR